MNAGAGATVIGARPFLIAYNVNLNSTDKNHASDLAFALREKGRVARSGNTAPYYSRGKKLFYREGALPLRQLRLRRRRATTRSPRTAPQEHGYDLGELLRANDLDAAERGRQERLPARASSRRARPSAGTSTTTSARRCRSTSPTYTVTPPHEVLEASREARGRARAGRDRAARSSAWCRSRP